jgi:hypothetical protein
VYNWRRDTRLAASWQSSGGFPVTPGAAVVVLGAEGENTMAKPAVDYDDMPSHPMAPKKASAHSGHVNSFVSKGKGKKKTKKRMRK